MSMRVVWVVLSAFARAVFLASFAFGRHELHRESLSCDDYADCSIRSDQPAMMQKKQA